MSKIQYFSILGGLYFKGFFDNGSFLGTSPRGPIFWVPIRPKNVALAKCFFYSNLPKIEKYLLGPTFGAIGARFPVDPALVLDSDEFLRSRKKPPDFHIV